MSDVDDGTSTRLIPRLEVLLADPEVPRWVTLLLDDVTQRGLAAIASVTLEDFPVEGSPALRDAAHRLHARLDEFLFGHRRQLTVGEDIRTWARAHNVDVVTLERSGVHPSRARADLALDLRAEDHHREGADARGAAVWILGGVPLRRADARGRDLRSAILAGRQTVPFWLLQTPAGTSAVRDRFDCVCPAHPTSAILTEESLAASASQLLTELLANWPGGQGGTAVRGRRNGSSLSGSDVPPLPSRVSYAAAARFFVQGVRRQVDKAVTDHQWQLLIGRQPVETLLPDPRALRCLEPPRDCYWADPFVIAYEGREYVFFEEFEYASRKGRIAAVTLEPDGTPRDKVVALELQSHLSYPCVFAHAGRLFMIPENAASGRLDLYECLRVPDRWEYRRTLIDGVALVDASIVFWDGLWWLFASVKKPASVRTAELLMVYCADDPVRGVWRPHTLNPLRADITAARPAGVPFVHGGRLYRPAQDGSGGYGHGIALFEVARLTPDEYKDQRCAELTSAWIRYSCGMHTLNRAGATVVMDLCKRVPRDPRRPGSQGMLE